AGRLAARRPAADEIRAARAAARPRRRRPSLPQIAERPRPPMTFASVRKEPSRSIRAADARTAQRAATAAAARAVPQYELLFECRRSATRADAPWVSERVERICDEGHSSD